MADVLAGFARRHELLLPPELESLYRAMPTGADLGTIRFLSPEEVVGWRGPLSASLLPIAEGESDVFALYVPPEPGARISAVCAASLTTGVYAPVSSTLRGFAAWLIALRGAQAAQPALPGLPVHELLEETEASARRLAEALGVSALLDEDFEPDLLQLARAMLRFDAGAPWARSHLARAEQGEAAVKALAPALGAAPFAVGLLEQATDLFLELGQERRAVRSLGAALTRYEPNLQTAPFRLDEPDEESGELFEPFQTGAAFRFLQEHSLDLSPELRGSAAMALLPMVLGAGGDCSLKLAPELAIDLSRRRGLAGDLPGGRWVLHLALGELLGDEDARRMLARELAVQWDLAGSAWYAARFRSLAGEP